MATYTVAEGKVVQAVWLLQRRHVSRQNTVEAARALLTAGWPNDHAHQAWLDSATAEDLAEWLDTLLLAAGEGFTLFSLLAENVARWGSDWPSAYSA